MMKMKKVLAAVMICVLMLSGCGGEKMIGPRSEDAWKRWEEHQKALKAAKAEADAIFASDPLLERVEHAALRKRVESMLRDESITLN